MTGDSKPDYSRSVDMLTRSAIKEMIIPSMLPVLSPIILFIVSIVADQNAAVSAVGAMLLGVIVTGIFVAISMTAGGGAWDNARNMLKMEILAVKDQRLIKLRSQEILLETHIKTLQVPLLIQ